LDLQMPGMTGLQLLHHLAGMALTIPTIVVTANDEPGMRHRCELAGAMLCLLKPVSGEALVNAIQEAITQERKKSRTD
jgi:CheY-like chemotaxis protein